jgi:hypothetical protein
MREQMTRMANYNLWANRRVLEMIPDDKNVWETVQDSSFATIKLTMLHIWDAEYIWLQRLKGNSLDHWPSESFRGTNQELTTGMLSNSQDFFQYLDAQLPAYATMIVSYNNMKGEAFSNTSEEIVTHCMNHSTFHRGQVITMLRHMGVKELHSTDFISYLRERQAKRAEILD